jgi:hypothetical protein
MRRSWLIAGAAVAVAVGAGVVATRTRPAADSERSERDRHAEHTDAIDAALKLAIQKLAHEIAELRKEGGSARDVAALEAKKGSLERQLAESATTR